MGKQMAESFSKATANYDEPTDGDGLVCRKPLLLYLALSLSAIGALIAQKYGGSIDQPVYYVSRALREVETRYP